jgi:hypothetical protein
MPCMGRPASPFIVEGDGGLQAREVKGEKRKRRKRRKRKQKEGVVYGVVSLLLLMGCYRVGDEDVRHP